MRRIAVVLGSTSDLSQCLSGLQLLKEAVGRGEIELVGDEIRISSIHRATEDTLNHLYGLHESDQPPDVIITGAGMVAALSGVADSYLRHELRNTGS